jgi:hypothetical protein
MYSHSAVANMVQLPEFCNLHLAISESCQWVFAISGAAEVFDKYLGDNEDNMIQAPGLFVANDMPMSRA